jgi:hypothetical protein
MVMFRVTIMKFGMLFLVFLAKGEPVPTKRFIFQRMNGIVWMIERRAEICLLRTCLYNGNPFHKFPTIVGNPVVIGTYGNF